jgi:6,7-dimethyl-8-ribityllumazine synthase
LARILEGGRQGHGRRFAVVVSRFNREVTEKLLEGALAGLDRCGVESSDIVVTWVPGAFEIPVAAKRLALSGRFAAVVCAGAVIKGETPHWEHISSAASHALALASTETGVPIAFAVLTTETEEQALSRAGVGGGDNRGFDAAVAAVEMADLLDRLRPEIA